MRFEIARGGSGLTYDIRNLVPIAKKIQDFGVKIIWENIGDPVQKGENIPDWMKEVLIDIIKEDSSYAYSPTKGVDDTRAFIADRVNSRGKIQITPEDVIFFNGLGDAIARAYRFHALYGGSASCFISVQYVPDESLQQLAS
jgi:aspartate/methionine/tyrosine aminotransferase